MLATDGSTIVVINCKMEGRDNMLVTQNNIWITTSCRVWTSLTLSFNFTDELLIKWGWPEDVWFHVDKLSSAHVYLRLAEVGSFYFCF